MALSALAAHAALCRQCLDQNRRLHKEEMELMHKQHRDQMLHAKKLYEKEKVRITQHLNRAQG